MVVATLFGGFIEPEESEFKSASPASRMKILAAGSTANISLCILILPLVMMTPFFPMAIPEPVEALLYEPPEGILITSIEGGMPVAEAGLTVGDVIVEMNGRSVRSREDYRSVQISPDRPVEINVLRGGRGFSVLVTPKHSSTNASQGILGLGGVPYSPSKIFPLGFGFPIPVAAFIFWLWFLSFNVAIFNMLPFYPLDGDGYLNALLDRWKNRRNVGKVIRASANVFALGLLGGNLATSFITSGLLTL